MKNKKFIITGPTSGIGKSIAYNLDKAGASLVLVARDEGKLSDLKNNLSGDHEYLVADLVEVEKIKEILKPFIASVDGFVHSAGMESNFPINFLDISKFETIMRLHVYSFLEIVKIISLEKKRSDSRMVSVVGISSVAAHDGGVGQTIYAASKAALEACSRSLSKELVRKKIRINTIRPGLVNTEMTERWRRRSGIAEKSELEQLQWGGVAEPQDISDLAIFLLSETSKHINGSVINIDGGGQKGALS